MDYVEEDQIVEISAEPWHTDRVDQQTLKFNKKFCPPNGGEGVDIYILDTGINYCHEDFCLNRARYAGYSPVVLAENPNAKGEDCHGHGTHVAALAAGGIHGIARKARVYSLPVFNCQAQGSISNTILALNHVAQLATANPQRRSIISMSLTSGLSRAVNEAVERVSSPDELPQGILVVTAAGNFKRDACQFSPASSQSTITVGGTARNDFLYWNSQSGTNYGRCVDIFAPGAEVTSASYESCSGETVMSGTSMATPIVAGAAAIVWSEDMSLTHAQVKEKLLSQSIEGVLDFSQLAPSQRTVTPNRFVYTKKSKSRVIDNSWLLLQFFSIVTVNCKNIKKMECDRPAEIPLCGKPWTCNVTILVTSVRINNLKSTINNHRTRNLIPIYISPYLKGTDLYFAIIFKPVDNFKFYRIEFALDTQAMTTKVLNLAKKKFYPIFATSYRQNGKIFHLVVLQRMSTPPMSQFYLAQSEADYMSTARSNRKLNVGSLAVTQNAQGTLNYTTLFVKSDAKTVISCDLTFKSLLRKVNKQKNKEFTLKSIDTYTVNDETRFCAVFTDEAIGECEYIFVHSYSEKDIKNIAEAHRNDGYRIVAVVVHSQRSFPLFMAVFKK